MAKQREIPERWCSCCLSLLVCFESSGNANTGFGKQRSFAGPIRLLQHRRHTACFCSMHTSDICASTLSHTAPCSKPRERRGCPPRPVGRWPQGLCQITCYQSGSWPERAGVHNLPQPSVHRPRASKQQSWFGKSLLNGRPWQTKREIPERWRSRCLPPLTVWILRKHTRWFNKRRRSFAGPVRLLHHSKTMAGLCSTHTSEI